MTESSFQSDLSKWCDRIRPFVEPSDLGKPYRGT